MSRKLIFVLALLTIIGVVLPVHSQEPFEPRCSKADIQTMIEMIQGGFFALLEEEDMTTAWQVISALNGTYNRIYALCSPLSFEGENQQVIGPIDIPAGVYRVILTTEGYFIADVEPIDGQCEARGFTGLFNVTSGRANQGAESLLISDGCEALIVTSNVSAPWTLVFEKIS